MIKKLYLLWEDEA